ncbi:MAG: hypothetical protein CBC25_06040 [Pelagibacteraceae bacterium TMED65]|nr:hypothetical protein [Rickettsiales bacterium]OUU51229.1 MAG: hypothetical protein CBC25_06040 [Pelagibacteraceae bacterium TMED65]
MKIISFLIIFFVFSDKSACSNPKMFEEFESNQSFKGEYLSEFSIGAESDNKWKDLFVNKKFKEVKSFIEILPVNSTDETIQNLIYDILVSRKKFDRDLIGLDEDKLLFKTIVNKLFQTGRLSEIELIYSQTSELENNTFIIKKMIEGNLLRNRHSEACKILEKVNQDPLFFGKIMIICNIINSKFDQAKLGLQLLKEQNQPGDIFFIDLAFSLMSEKDITESEDLKKNLDQIKELNPIIMSSLQFADISPNFEQIEKLTTSGLLFILSNPSVDTDLKIFCSEILVKQGRISVEMLSEAYRLSRFEPKEIQNAEKIYKSLSRIRARPLLYQSIIRDNKPESKFRKIIALIKISKIDNLLPKMSYLLEDLIDYKKFARNHEDTVLISQMFQSKNKYLEARDILNVDYKSPESDYRNLAIDISEYLKNNSIDYYLLEKQLEKFEDLKIQDSVILRKLLMVLISNIELDQNLLEKIFNIADVSQIKSVDAKNFFLANALSLKGDYFNSLTILFKIIGNKDLLELNIMESFSVLTILKNLGFLNEFKNLSKRILL